MGREVKRVALDFDWPLDTVWGGYVNPFYRQCVSCPDCEGRGESPHALRLSKQWYGNAPFAPEDRGSQPFRPDEAHVRAFARRNVERDPDFYGHGEQAIAREARRLAHLWNGSWSHHLNEADVAALVAAGRLRDFTHTWSREGGWQPKDPPYVPTAAEVNIWSCSGMGHDSLNQWVCVRAECARLGFPLKCARCHGDGQLWPKASVKEAAEHWTKTEPPAGDGWQVWETVSEGSPVTPVFATAEELMAYLVEGGDAWDRKHGEPGWKQENAEAFVRAGWAPSLVLAEGRLIEPRSMKEEEPQA